MQDSYNFKRNSTVHWAQGFIMNIIQPLNYKAHYLNVYNIILAIY